MFVMDECGPCGTQETNGSEIWIDERGKKVFIEPFFSRVYVDEETEALSKEFAIWECDGEQRLSSLGKAQRESLAVGILALVRVTNLNPRRIVGVEKEELESVAKRTSDHWYVNELVSEGYLRQRWIRGRLVVFPTRALLESQRIGKGPWTASPKPPEAR